MNIEVIKDRLDAYALAEVLADKEARVDIWDNTLYSIFSDGAEIFKMYVLKDSSLVFFVNFSSSEAKTFEKLIKSYSYTKSEESLSDRKYNAQVTIKRYSFQFHIFDQEIAEELVDVILKFRGGIR